jgi:hypothetical protein
MTTTDLTVYEMNDIVHLFKGKQDIAFAEKKNFYFSTDFGYYDASRTIQIVKRYKGFDSYESFFKIYWTIPINQRHFYYMMTGEWLEIYDIDGKWTDDIYMEKSLDNIKDDFLYVRNLFLKENIYTNSQDQEELYLWKDSSDEEKVSLHLTIRNGYKFKNVDEIKAYITCFRQFITENNYQVKLDKTIYSENRNIRINGSSKLGSDRFFIVSDDKISPEMYCGNYFEGNEIFVERFDDEPMVNEVKKREKSKYSNFNNEKIPDGDLKKLIDLIYESVDNGQHSLCDTENETKMCYDDWKKLAFAIIRITNGNCQAEFHRIYDLYRNADDYDARQKYNEMRKYTNYGWTAGSLHYWAKENPKYDEIFKKESLLRKYDALKKKYEPSIFFLENKEYNNFYDFNNFVDRISSLKAIKKCLKSTIIEVQNSGKNPFFIIKTFRYDENLKSNIEVFVPNVKQIACLKKQVKFLNPNYESEIEDYFTVSDDKRKTKTKKEPSMTISTYLWYNDRKVPNIFTSMYEKNEIQHVCHVVNEPYFIKEPEHYKDDFNMFRGFQLINDNFFFESKTSNFEKSHTYNHLKTYMLPNKEDFEYYLNYVAHMIQKPAELPLVAILFFSKQGNGKDLTIATLNAKLIGYKYYVNFGEINDFLGHFTADQESKLLTIINEVAEGGADNQMFKKANVMKDKITRAHAKIEYKGVDPIWLKHTSRYIYFTNHKTALQLDSSDRRHFPIECLNDKLNDREYFKPIADEINDVDFLKSTFSFFAHRDISKFDPPNIPTSTYKNEIKILNMNSTLRFLRDMYEDYEIPERFTIQCSDLYDLYKIYCRRTGSTAVQRKTFFEQAKCVLDEEGRRKYNSMEMTMGSHTRRILDLINYSTTDFIMHDKQRNFYCIRKNVLTNRICQHLNVPSL